MSNILYVVAKLAQWAVVRLAWYTVPADRQTVLEHTCDLSLINSSRCPTSYSSYICWSASWRLWKWWLVSTCTNKKLTFVSYVFTNICSFHAQLLDRCRCSRASHLALCWTDADYNVGKCFLFRVIDGFLHASSQWQTTFYSIVCLFVCLSAKFAHLHIPFLYTLYCSPLLIIFIIFHWLITPDQQCDSGDDSGQYGEREEARGCRDWG